MGGFLWLCDKHFVYKYWNGVLNIVEIIFKSLKWYIIDFMKFLKKKRDFLDFWGENIHILCLFSVVYTICDKKWRHENTSGFSIFDIFLLLRVLNMFIFLKCLRLSLIWAMVRVRKIISESMWFERNVNISGLGIFNRKTHQFINTINLNLSIINHLCNIVGIWRCKIKEWTNLVIRFKINDHWLGFPLGNTFFIITVTKHSISFESNKSDKHDFDECDELSHKMVKPHEENNLDLCIVKRSRKNKNKSLGSSMISNVNMLLRQWRLFSAWLYTNIMDGRVTKIFKSDWIVTKIDHPGAS